MCELEAMFYHFKVNKMHRNFLIFFWWKDSNTNSQPIAYRMTVHFGRLNRHQDVQTMDLRGLQKITKTSLVPTQPILLMMVSGL